LQEKKKSYLIYIISFYIIFLLLKLYLVNAILVQTKGGIKEKVKAKLSKYDFNKKNKIYTYHTQF